MSFDQLERIHVTVVCYGDDYVRLLLDVTAPNLCSLVLEIPDDLRRNCKCRIFTTKPYVEQLEAAPVIAQLRRAISTEIEDAVEFRNFEEYGGYAPMCVAQARLVQEASAEQAAIIFVGPDLVMSAGSFRMFVDRARQGYRAVIGPSLRAITETALPQLQQMRSEHPHGLVEMPSADLARFVLNNWHPINDTFIWNCPPSNTWKSYIYYQTRPGDLLVRFFQGPMFFAWPNRVIEKYWGWVDHALVTMCCDEQEQVYVVRDLLECLACDLTPRERKEGHRLSRTSVFDLLKQLLDLKFINRMNIRYGLITCHVHTGEDQSDEWKVAARRFAHEIDPIIHLSLPLRAVRRAWKVTRGFSLSDLWPWIANRLLQLLAKILSPLFRTRW